jgi:hypothetical protein
LTSPGRTKGETIERALEVGGFDTVQASWNLLERSAAPALAAAHEAGLGVIVKEALATGVLEHVPDYVALAAALAQPWADVVLSGAATTEHLESNLRALDVDYTEDLDAELAGLVEAGSRLSRLPCSRPPVGSRATWAPRAGPRFDRNRALSNDLSRGNPTKGVPMGRLTALVVALALVAAVIALLGVATAGASPPDELQAAKSRPRVTTQLVKRLAPGTSRIHPASRCRAPEAWASIT